MSKDRDRSITDEEFMARALALSARVGDPPAFPRRDRPRPGDGRPGGRRAGPSAAPRLRRRRARRHAELHHLAELFRAGEPRRVHRRHRRRHQRLGLRLERGDAGQAAGRRHRLGRLRADQLHDLHLQGARPHRAARSLAAAELRPEHARRSASSATPRSTASIYAVPKDWGTTGYVVNTAQGAGRDDELEGFLGPRPGRPHRPRHGARLPAHDHRQRAEIFRLFVQLRRSEGARRGREAADRGEAASLRHQQRLPALDAQRRRLGVGLLDRRRHAAEARHAGDGIRARQGGRRDLDRFLRHPEGRAAHATRPTPSSTSCSTRR